MTQNQSEARTAFEQLEKLGHDMGMSVVRGENYLRIFPAGFGSGALEALPNQFWHDQADEAMRVVAEGEACSIALPDFLKS